MRKVRTRFAPSPTGFLHIGGIRTALYNYLLAKKYNGDFILRIEDTDQNRFVPEAQEYIVNTLKWLGIEPNEGACFGEGDFGPYIQSQRKSIYEKYAELLVEKGFAYYAFDTDKELEEMHVRLSESNVTTPQYNYAVRNFMKNSLVLPKSEVESMIANGEPYVIRFKINQGEVVRFKDIIRGWIKVDTSTLDDKVLLKSDKMASYHLASVVDDYLMKISHIIRGEEWLPSAPLHVLLYRAFGWEEEMPGFVHLPLLLKPNGKGKLSKRDTLDEGLTIFPFSFFDKNSNKEITGFREKGFLREAILNAISLLGWSPGSNRELFSLDELINTFSLDRLQKSGSKFNIKKFEWFNHQHIINTPNSELFKYLKEYSNENRDKLNKVCDLVKERAYFTTDLYDNAKYFFKRPENFDKANLSEDNIKFSIGWIENFMSLIKDKPLEFECLHDFLKNLLEKDNLKFVDIMPTFRLIIFGKISGPDVIKSIIILGIDEVYERINNFKNYIL